MTDIFKFGLGDEVKDTVTNMKGIVISRTEYLNGCIRYGVQPQKLKDGLPVEAAYLDEDQLAIVKRAKKGAFGVRPGGPRPNPRNLPNPKR